MCGNDITLADFMGAASVSLGGVIGVKLGDYGNVARWLDSMRARPSWGVVFDGFDGFAGSLKGKSFISIGQQSAGASTCF